MSEGKLLVLISQILAIPTVLQCFAMSVTSKKLAG